MQGKWIAVLAISVATPLHAQDIQGEVDKVFEVVATSVAEAGLSPVVSIDHARLAAKEGVEMPASRVQIFSDSATESAILAAEIRAGLDLPYRVLTYDNGGAVGATYTDATFVAMRHDLGELPALSEWQATLDTILAPLGEFPMPVPTQDLAADYGIIELDSPYDLPESLQRLKDAVLSQGDTIWFGEHDFHARAASQDVVLPGATLLLFGGPAPGGVAMAQFPSIGVDAFCQKLFLYEGEDGRVKVLFNSIAALAELHYGTSAEPHHRLDARLTETFTNALKPR